MATQPLTAEVTYADGTSDDVTSQATWTSSDDAVATVDAAGIVTAVTEGTCTITAEFGGVSDTSAITVTNPPEALSVTPASASIEVS